MATDDQKRMEEETKTIDRWYKILKDFVLTECEGKGIDLEDEDERSFLASAFEKCEEWMWNYDFQNPHEDED